MAQEAVLPTRKTLVWESLTFPWQTCYTAAKVWLNNFPIAWFDALAPEIDTHTIGLPFSVILGIEIAKDEAQVMPLFTLQRWRHCLAYDPRDKVYGLMGMFRSSNFPRIQCDYTLSPAKVFARMTLDLFDLSKSFLPLFGLRGEQQVTPNLPTWALDMVRPENPINTGAKFWEHYDRQFFFNADARKGQKDRFYEYTNDESTLKLKGICIDKVYQVDIGIEVDEDDRRPTDEFIATLSRRKQQWLELTTEKQIEEYPVLGVSLRDAFWQTMLGGVLTENERVTRLVSSADITLYEEYETNGRNNEAAETIQSMILNQAFFITDRGFVGIGPPCGKPGDSAWVVYGSSVPLFMRSSQKDSTYTWLGDGYVHGTMFGELVEASGTEWVELLIC
jgi:hypothetical protein